MKNLWLLLLVGLTGCGSVQQTGSPVLSDLAVYKVGLHMDFVNSYGDHSYLDFRAATETDHLCEGPANQLVVHHTKTNARAYWGPSSPADEYEAWKSMPDGSWRLTQAWWNEPTSLWGGWASPETNQPIPYTLLIPEITIGGEFKTPQTAYHNRGIQEFTSDCAAYQDTGSSIAWATDFSTEYISTPIYQGMTMKAEYFEGMSRAWAYAHPQAVALGSEKWWFAPKIGPVQIQAPYCPQGVCQTEMIMKRIL